MKSSTKDPEEEKTRTIKTWKNAVKCSHIASVVLITFVAVGTLVPMHKYDNFFSISYPILLKEEQVVSKNGPIPGCNLFSGNKFPACAKYGRKNFTYQNWRWQPHNCDILRFNSSALLEKLRGKKLIFIGDSLGRNQWESMICLIITPFPTSSLQKWKVQSEGRLSSYNLMEYNVTIGFYWSPFLVESNSDSPGGQKPHNTTIRIKSIEENGRNWMDADILVFDSFAWWVVGHWFTILWGSFDGPDSIYKTAEISPRLYEIALNTWSDWLEMQINPYKTCKMFFMSHSPFHYGPIVPKIYHCISKEEPILDDKYWPSSVKRDLMHVVESIIEKLEQRGVKVEYLNITQLSGYRIDAHSGHITPHQSDCLHWCLPGVPDVWNQILYTYIMKS